MLPGLVVLFVGLRVVALTAPQPAVLHISSPVIVVGVTDRQQLSAVDRALLASRPAGRAVGAVSIRPRYIGDCAAAGWSTLGAGRRTGVGELCSPRVSRNRVSDWSQRLAAAGADHGDAQLGTLAGSVSGCVAAVGPGAALAAARPDGSLASYSGVTQYVAGGLRTSCPITLIDAGPASDDIISRLAKRSRTTLLVTGVGPPAGSSEPALQAVYLLGTGRSGWLSTDSTRRYGVVNLTDLTRTLIDVGSGNGSPTAAVDGAPLAVATDPVTAGALDRHLTALAALSTMPPLGFVGFTVATGVALVVVLGAIAVCLVRRRYPAARLLLTLISILTAALLLTGAVHWNASRLPGVTLSLLLVGWTAGLTGLALLVARVTGVRVAFVAATLTAAAYTVDAALGGTMQPGSLLNSRPDNGGRWYGFGNVTFSAYAAAALVLAGFLADRHLATGRGRAAAGVFALVGFGVVVCDGWPSMGADFGGILALTPSVLWASVRLWGIRVTWRTVLGIVGAPVVAVCLVAWLDWLRGPQHRSHLGNFVQRILDGDATDVVIRKGVASVRSFANPLGLTALVVGLALWVLIFRRLLPAVAQEWRPATTVTLAALATTALGTALNDGGVAVWITLTSAYAVSMATLWIEQHSQQAGAASP